MKAFISYSFNDEDMYLVSLLVGDLTKKGFSVNSSHNALRMVGSPAADYISSSDLFVGIVTKSGREHKAVIREWQHANKYGVPNLLLVEKGIHIAQPNNSIIEFDRTNPKAAIDKLVQIRNRSVHSISKPNEGVPPALVVGVVALGIAGLLALIASKE